VQHGAARKGGWVVQRSKKVLGLLWEQQPADSGKNKLELGLTLPPPAHCRCYHEFNPAIILKSIDLAAWK
jgi:hypothetical protein